VGIGCSWERGLETWPVTTTVSPGTTLDGDRVNETTFAFGVVVGGLVVSVVRGRVLNRSASNATTNEELFRLGVRTQAVKSPFQD
jgi:hypothetical protein